MTEIDQRTSNPDNQTSPRSKAPFVEYTQAENVDLDILAQINPLVDSRKIVK